MKHLTTLSNIDILRIAARYNIAVDGILCRDEVPTDLAEGYYIINLDKSTNGGTHWTCLVVGRGDDLYFDSFGVVSPSQIDRLAGRYIYSTVDLQDLNATSCGWWCLAFLSHVQSSADRQRGRDCYMGFLCRFTNCPAKNECILAKMFS